MDGSGQKRNGIANNGGYLLPTFQRDTATAMLNCGKTRITRSLTKPQREGQLADRHAGLFALGAQKRPALDPGLPKLNGFFFGGGFVQSNTLPALATLDSFLHPQLVWMPLVAATGTAHQRKPKKLGPLQTYFAVPLSVALRTEPAHGKRLLVIAMVRVDVLRSTAFARLRRDLTMFLGVMKFLVCGELFGMSPLVYTLAGKRKSRTTVDTWSQETLGGFMTGGDPAQLVGRHDFGSLFHMSSISLPDISGVVNPLRLIFGAMKSLEIIEYLP
jgi:hypothetical protein